MSIEFWCGITGDTQWNRHPIMCGDLACVSPVYGKQAGKRKLARVFVPEGVHVLQDSGAFSDALHQRLDFGGALERQIEHAEKYRYSDRIQYRVAYDLLIDEVWQDGQRHKRRWSVAQAESAVNTTVAAAEFLSKNRHGLDLILPAQGVDAEQYMRCVERVIPHMDVNRDVLGLGGWCVIGLFPAQMSPVFSDTLHRVIPYAARKGVKKVHIFGVIYPKALGWLLHICDDYGIAVSTDSTSPQLAPTRGEWGYGKKVFGGWRDNSYERHPPETRGLERARHTQLTREWLANLRSTSYYVTPPCERKPFQLSMF